MGSPNPSPWMWSRSPLQLPDARTDAATLSGRCAPGRRRSSAFRPNRPTSAADLDFPWWDEGALGRRGADRARGGAHGGGTCGSKWQTPRGASTACFTKATTPNVTWTLPDAPERDKAVVFEIRGDPWAPFHVRVTP